MKITNPATGKKITVIEEDDKYSIQEKYQKSKVAGAAWKRSPVEQRIKKIESFCLLLLENCEPLARELTEEVGKPLSEARGEIKGAVARIQFFINESADLLSKKKVNTAGNTSEYLTYDPLGVIANISAWNYPYLVAVNVFVPALICGNSVLYKPSEFSSRVGMRIAEYLLKAGIPQNVFQPIYGEAQAGQDLLDLPLDGYFFTGSYKTGQKIASAVSHKLVPIGMELGGKDPLYITNSIADIPAAAINAAAGAFYNNGQSCCSVERIYVHADVYDEFIDSFVKEVSSYSVGDPLDENTVCGAITRSEHLIFLQAQVQNAVANGAKILCGGSQLERVGNFFSPTVLVDVNHQMDIMTEETFGPIIGIQKVASDDEAITLMNDTVYGLTSAVFSDDFKRGEAILAKINSGTGYLNCCDRISGYLPWSGRGNSGLGSTLSQHGLYAFCQPKAYHIRG